MVLESDHIVTWLDSNRNTMDKPILSTLDVRSVWQYHVSGDGPCHKFKLRNARTPERCTMSAEMAPVISLNYVMPVRLNDGHIWRC